MTKYFYFNKMYKKQKYITFYKSFFIIKTLITDMVPIYYASLVILNRPKYQWNKVYYLQDKYSPSKTRETLMHHLRHQLKRITREFGLWSDHRSLDWIYSTAQMNQNNLLQHPHHPTPKSTWFTSRWNLSGSQKAASLKFAPPHLSSLTRTLFWQIWWQSKSK